MRPVQKECLVAFHLVQVLSHTMVLAVHPSPDLVLVFRKMLHGRYEAYDCYGKGQLRGANCCWITKNVKRRIEFWHRAHASDNPMLGDRLAHHRDPCRTRSGTRSKLSFCPVDLIPTSFGELCCPCEIRASAFIERAESEYLITMCLLTLRHRHK